MQCPNCKDKPNENCYYCRGTKIVPDAKKEQAEEERVRNYEQEWRDRTS